MESFAGSGFSLVHTAVPGRLRIHVPGMKSGRKLKDALEAAVRGMGSVRSAAGSLATGNLLIAYDPKADRSEIVEAVKAAFLKIKAGGTGIPDAGRSGFPWHVVSVEDAFRRLRSSMLGLSVKSFRRRLRRYGENALPVVPGRDRLDIFLEQFKSLPVALLIGAAALSIATGGAADAVVVLSVVALNAGIGFYTEAQAERAVRALSEPLDGGVAVLRQGKRETIAVECAVPGDILDLRPGVVIAADARVVISQGLMVNEATLTGESAPVRKSPEPLATRDAALADRANIVYRGTTVTGGSGLALVVATGPATQIGLVQGFLGTASAPETPLQQQLGRLGRQLTFVAGGACALVFLVGLLRGYGAFATFKNAIALAVAAVPEGLPTLATTTLALGVREMRRQHVLVRRLDAVETLASVKVVCLDKTGTLTFNRMSAAEISCGGRRYVVRDDEISDSDGRAPHLDAAPELRKLAEIVALCNEATNRENEAPASATEAALLKFASDLGLDVEGLRRDHPIERIAYRTERQMFMISVHASRDGEKLAAVKGSPEAVLDLCDGILMGGKVVALSDDLRAQVAMENARLAGSGQRVLGAAYNALGRDASNLQQRRFVFVGLIGLADPLRPGVAELLAAFRGAGIDPVMVTGDQKATAAAIARQLDLGNGELRLVDSETFADVWDKSGAGAVPHVFARVTPGQKLEIVKALQHSGLVVAMTGDGVNDSPALKAADIGVAMGRGGSEAARDVAHIVLQDDNLGSLIPAIRQGRATHANIRRAIRYLLATNLSEILLMLLAPAAALGQPLTPAQLLWINLVTDVAPALALGVEPPHRDAMQAPPMPAHEDIVNPAAARALGREAGLIAAGSFGAYAYGCARYGVSPRARSICFVSIVSAQLLHALSCRSREHGFLSRELPPNKALLGVVLGSFALQAAAMAFPPLRRLLGAAPIGPVDALVAFAGAGAPFAANEALKAAGRLPGKEKFDDAESAFPH